MAVALTRLRVVGYQTAVLALRVAASWAQAYVSELRAAVSVCAPPVATPREIGAFDPVMDVGYLLVVGSDHVERG